MKALLGAFNQEKALVGAFSVIVQPVVEPMDSFTALLEALEAALETAHADMGKALEEAQQTLNGNIIV